MAVPKYHEFYNIFLESLSDGQIHYWQDCKEYIKRKMNFTPEELAETIPSGQPTWINRIGWCCTHLKKAGLVYNPKRAYLQLTENGKKFFLRE